MEESDFARKIRAAWVFLKDRADMVRIVGSLASLGVDEEFRRLALTSEVSYRSVYILGLARSHYNILLKDFAYFQFTWESKSAWRLAYFPNPWITGVVNAEEKLVEWEGLTELGLLANDDVDEFVAELPYLGSVPPVRFEFSLIQYREVSHPAAHMHIGHHADNRWPFARLLDPLTFAMMLTKFYYPTVWNAQSQYANGTVHNCIEVDFMECLVSPGRVHNFSENERRTLYFTSR